MNYVLLHTHTHAYIGIYVQFSILETEILVRIIIVASFFTDLEITTILLYVLQIAI